MSYNFKKIIDLDLVNEVPEGANVLIETDGATKRLPSTAIKPAPIQPDMAQNDPTAPDYVKNRTHYEETMMVNEPLNITWDGNTEGLLSVNGFLYKISDIVLTDEQIASASVYTNSGEEIIGCRKVSDNISLIGEELGVVFANIDNAALYGLVLPEAGIYFATGYGMYISSLTTTEPVEQTKTVVKKLDKKFLPDDIGGGVFRVNVSYDNANSEWVCDKTYDEIKAAENAKIPIVGTFTNRDGQVFTCIGCDMAAPCCYLAAFDVSSSSELFIYKIVVEENKASVVGLTLTATPTEV